MPLYLISSFTVCWSCWISYFFIWWRLESSK